MLMATRQKHQIQQLPFNLNFETTPVEQVSKHRLLRVTVDEQLKWQTHINNICRTVSRNIFLLSGLGQIVRHKAFSISRRFVKEIKWNEPGRQKIRKTEFQELGE